MKITMEVELIEEAGYRSALRGLSLNKKQTKDMASIARRLAHFDGGHNKFLEMMYIWIEVKGARYFWAEADTYRMSVKSSESTMHTLIKELENNDLTDECFEQGSVDEAYLNLIKQKLNIKDETEKLVGVKQILPEGFLQKRVWCMNYKTLRNITQQRHNHRLPHWQSFIKQILSQIEHPEFIIDDKEIK